MQMTGITFNDKYPQAKYIGGTMSHKHTHMHTEMNNLWTLCIALDLGYIEI